MWSKRLRTRSKIPKRRKSDYAELVQPVGVAAVAAARTLAKRKTTKCCYPELEFETVVAPPPSKKQQRSSNGAGDDDDTDDLDYEDGSGGGGDGDDDDDDDDSETSRTSVGEDVNINPPAPVVELGDSDDKAAAEQAEEIVDDDKDEFLPRNVTLTLDSLPSAEELKKRKEERDKALRTEAERRQDRFATRLEQLITARVKSAIQDDKLRCLFIIRPYLSADRIRTLCNKLPPNYKWIAARVRATDPTWNNKWANSTWDLHIVWDTEQSSFAELYRSETKNELDRVHSDLPPLAAALSTMSSECAQFDVY